MHRMQMQLVGTDVPWSACLCVSLCVLDVTRSCAKTAEPIEVQFDCVPSELCIRWGWDSPRGSGIFGDGPSCHGLLTICYIDDYYRCLTCLNDHLFLFALSQVGPSRENLLG